MKIGVLLSGGKDSLYAAYLANKEHELVCNITIKSENKESYMFHTPNIDGVNLQSEAMELPLITVITKGEKEKELQELKEALKQAKEKHGIEGITTGAVASQYQASRIQAICHELDLWCFNPLWQIEQNQLLQELLDTNFEVFIAGVFAYPFDETWLGKTITPEQLRKLKTMQDKFEINPAGEGGEIESYVLDCPLFKKKIVVQDTQTQYNNYAGTCEITKATLAEKETKKIIEQEKETIQKEADVLIINTGKKERQLFDHEFIRPITDIITQSKKTYRVVYLDELDNNITEQHIIISGTALKDNFFLEDKEKIQQLITLDKPILGICAGAELLLPKDVELEEVFEVGPKRVETLHNDSLTSDLDGKECFFLHQLGIRTIPFNSDLKGLLATEKGIAAYKYPDKPIYGIQFHPEVSQKKLLKKFLEM